MSKDAQNWKACPPGELGRLGRRLRGQRRRRFALKAGGALAVLFVTIGFLRVYGPLRDNIYAGLTCSEVMKNTMAYKQGRLDADLRDRVKSHVEQCGRCHALFWMMGLAYLAEPDGWAHATMLALVSGHVDSKHAHALHGFRSVARAASRG